MTSTFQQLASKASEKYLQTILSIAQGNEHDPETVMQIARDAGRSAIQLAADVETATDRFELDKEHHSRNWHKELEKAAAEYKAAVKRQEAASAAHTAAREAAQAAGQDAQRLLSLRDTLEQQRNEAANSFMRHMKLTAGDDRDTSDWRNLRLAE